MADSIEIAKQILSLAGKFSEEDLKLLAKAYTVALYAHENYYRDSGEPFIAHPVEVCKILAQMNVDIQTLVSAMLHDAVEDSDGKVKIEDVEREFGKQIARIVDGVTKVSRLNAPVGTTDSKLKLETIQKMLFAMAEDIRVIFVKLADRLHNMRTIEFVRDEAKKIYKAKETLEIYAPIAHKMGIYSMKWELEDLAFKVLNRNEYNRIKSLVAEKKKEREQRIKEYVQTLEKALRDNEIDGYVEGRFKHYYGIWQKLREKGKSFNEIYDLFGIRAIVNDVPTCYSVLGVVHSIWKPLPGRIKDYIASPKSNGYRSLHTTVITGYGEPLEVQIRDKEMHAEAEYGLIAHWIYKNGVNVKTMQKWVSQLLEWRKELTRDLSGLEEFKKELQMDEVFVFTPKGEVKHLPAGATPIDFAYSIHTDIGHRFAGAKVNGKLVPVSYLLKNGDLVEIIVGKTAKPSLDWLKYAKSPRTKAKIRKYFREQLQNELMERGKDVFRRVSKRLSKSMEEIMGSELVKKYLQNQGISEEEFYSRIGEGTITYGELINLLTPLVEKTQPKAQEEKRKPRSLLSTIEVSGLKNIEIHMGKCCGPVFGDEIIGVIGKRGLTIHRVNCSNIKHVETDRIFEARWNKDVQSKYETTLRVTTREKADVGMFVQLLENKGISVLGVPFMTSRKSYSIISLSILVSDLRQLEEAKKTLEGVNTVILVERGKLS